MSLVVAIDAGTTGVRSLALDETGVVVDVAYRELTQHFPRPGWVEHDPTEIWAHVQATLQELLDRRDHRRPEVIAITNQRETVVAWDRRNGRPLHRAIVWQDRRTAARCQELVELGHLETIRTLSGLVPDPYFSATKIEWLLTQPEVSKVGEHLAVGTIDAWVLWNLSGGAAEGILATDSSNASRTMLFDIHRCQWSPELIDLFSIPLDVLPTVVPSCGQVAVVRNQPRLAGTPIGGIAGDQQAALFGQACFDPGMTKATFGTGSFVLSTIGSSCPPPHDGLLTTIAWDLGHGPTYALEGSTFASGAAIQWLRDGLGIIERFDGLGPLAGSVPDSGGVFLVPAFAGLGSPWWDPTARGTILGLTRGTGRAQFARAVVECIAFNTRAILDAMAASGFSAGSLRVDGGAAVMDLLLQLQADQLGLPVARPTNTEATARGAAMLAGLGIGVWDSLEALAELWVLDAQFTPKTDRCVANNAYERWCQAVERSRSWAWD